MSRNSIATIAVGVLLAGSVGASACNAASPDFCRDYARAAVTQFREAREHHRCHDLLRNDSNQFHGDYKAHFEWCLGASFEDASRERNERTRALRECIRD